MYNSIKLSNQSSLNIKESRETINKLPIIPRKIPLQAAGPGEPLAAPSILILSQPSEGNCHLTGRG